MNYFSYLYQCNMIRVFPLRAGVIGEQRKSHFSISSVSPACGGYRLLRADWNWTPECFPCVRGLSGF